MFCFNNLEYEFTETGGCSRCGNHECTCGDSATEEWVEQNVPPDEEEPEKVVLNALERVEKGSWKAVKALLEVDNEQ